ncbi:MAG: VOC family protein [Acidimicrobiia bacterium]|nr:VOC family protein [Acidimicrobiia bacterium]
MAFDLDHVALAAPDISEALDLFAGTLGGTITSGGQTVGFRPVQVWIGDSTGEGMTVELIEPWDVEHNDFLARFLAAKGAGPHHLTFKVPDLVAALDRVREAGYTPVQVDLSEPEWREAFLMPREAHGTVVQLAQPGEIFADRAAMLARIASNGPRQHPRWWHKPAVNGAPPSYLRRVVLATASLPSGLGFFGALLGGHEGASGDGWVELAWPGGARLRLEERHDRPPGIDRLEIDGVDAEITVAGTRLATA